MSVRIVYCAYSHWLRYIVDCRGGNSSFSATPDADLMLAIAATMLSEGVAPKASCPSMIDSKLTFFLNLLQYRRVAGMLQFSKLSLMHTPQREVQHFACWVWLHLY
jgi:hypothetical protein